jgi:tRNA threonylcarbamoyladenosine biosynthesis protein TsaE
VVCPCLAYGAVPGKQRAWCEMVAGNRKALPFFVYGIMLHVLMKSSSGCLAFGSGTRTVMRRTMRAASSSTRLAQSADGISTFGPDEPNILPAESDKDDAYTLKLSVPTPEDMEDVGAILSMGTSAADTILLGGDLGAGKTCFSRGFIRARTGDADLRVTSPTYLLCNTYPSQDGMLIHHMDLYRLSGKEEDLQPLDMDHVLKDCISLIEWPSRLGNITPPKRLDIIFRISHDDSEDNDSEEIERTLMLRAHGNQWEERLKFLEEEGYVDDLLCE